LLISSLVVLFVSLFIRAGVPLVVPKASRFFGE
jgi:hypothetical protein